MSPPPTAPRRRRRLVLALCVFATLASFVAFVVWNGRPLSSEQAARSIDRSLAELVAEGEVRGALAFVDAPRLGIVRGFAHGRADARRGTPMTTSTPFLSASTGKMFVAAAILSLVEEGSLSLEDEVVRHVPREAIAGLPVVGGDAALARITVRQLLAHRSGLPDYFSDPSRDGTPRLFDRLVHEPDRGWTRAQMLDQARAHYDPVGAPGAVFHYADTNYDLLGMVLEGVTGQPFHRVVRARVIEPLGLRGTYYHAFESPPEGAPEVADVYVLGRNLRGARSLQADQAGGGLVTTLADLRAFLRGLVAGRPVALSAFDGDLTADAMHAGIGVGRCLWRIRPGDVFFALGGIPELVGHSGATGVFAYYVPAWDAVLVGALNDASWQERHLEFLLSEIAPVLARVPTR